MSIDSNNSNTNKMTDNSKSTTKNKSKSKSKKRKNTKHYADKNGRAGGSHFCANHSHKGNATWQIDIGFDHDPVLDKRVITWDTSRTPFGMYWHKKRKCLLEMQDDISAEITATITELNNMIEYRRNSCKFVYSIFKIACKNVSSTMNDGAS